MCGAENSVQLANPDRQSSLGQRNVDANSMASRVGVGGYVGRWPSRPAGTQNSTRDYEEEDPYDGGDEDDGEAERQEDSRFLARGSVSVSPPIALLLV